MKRETCKKDDRPAEKPNPAHPTVSDPPVPNRAHTEMVTEFPPEVPNKPRKEL